MAKFLVGYFNDFEETYDIKIVEGEEDKIKALVDKYNDEGYDTEYFYTKCEEPIGLDKLEAFFKEAEDDDDDEEEYEDYHCYSVYNSEDKHNEQVSYEEGSPFIEKKKGQKLETLLKIIDKLREVIIVLIIIALGVGLVDWICDKI